MSSTFIQRLLLEWVRGVEIYPSICMVLIFECQISLFFNTIVLRIRWLILYLLDPLLDSSEVAQVLFFSNDFTHLLEVEVAKFVASLMLSYHFFEIQLVNQWLLVLECLGQFLIFLVGLSYFMIFVFDLLHHWALFWHQLVNLDNPVFLSAAHEYAISSRKWFQSLVKNRWVSHALFRLGTENQWASLRSYQASTIFLLRRAAK